MSVAVFLFFFFFQAEDGIRDLYETGVQTCALPISALRTAVIPSPVTIASSAVTQCRRTASRGGAQPESAGASSNRAADAAKRPTPRASAASPTRSEERRVGKEGRARRAARA